MKLKASPKQTSSPNNELLSIRQHVRVIKKLGNWHSWIRQSGACTYTPVYTTIHGKLSLSEKIQPYRPLSSRSSHHIVA